MLSCKTFPALQLMQIRLHLQRDAVLQKSTLDDPSFMSGILQIMFLLFFFFLFVFITVDAINMRVKGFLKMYL